MFRRPTTHSKPIGSARKVATVLLLAAMFLVPMAPMGSATNPTAFAVGVVSGSVAGGTAAVYNFTFTIGDSDVNAVELTLPSGFDMGPIEVTNLPAGYQDAPGTVQANFTDATDLPAGSYYVRINGTTVPRYADTFTATLKIYNATSGVAANGTISANFAVSAASLTIDTHPSHEDGGADDINYGSGAVTDYYFNVTDLSMFQTGDSINFTFPSAFDLDDATIGSTAASGSSVGYAILGTEAAAFTIKIDDVENPVVAINTFYDDIVVSAKTSDGKTIATGNFDIRILSTAIEVDDNTGSTTLIEEGKTEDDSIKVFLKTKPADDVTVTFDGGDQVDFDEDDLTFTTSNWATPQVIKLTAVDDDDAEGTTTFDITFTSESDDDNYDKLEATFTIEILDNDEGIVLRHLDADGDEDDDTIVTEDDSTGDTYEVVLATKPKSAVTVTVDPDSKLKVDDTELTFTTSNWNTPQEIKVTAARANDATFQDDQEATITHTTSSSDSDYDDLEVDLAVTITDDEHPALGLTEDMIAEANALVELTLTEDDDGMLLEWVLPDQDDLNDIFDFTNGEEIEVQGIQILTSNSPYVIAETFDDGDDEFDNGEWLHDFDDGASVRTKYLVTMYFDEDVGLWDDDDVPDTRDDGYEGTRFKDPFLAWWGWLIIGVVGVILIAGIIVAVVAAQNRRTYGDGGWDDDAEDAGAPVPAAAAPVAVAAASTKDKPRKHDLECPVCDHQFSVKGVKPIKTECPNCGAKGVLN